MVSESSLHSLFLEFSSSSTPIAATHRPFEYRRTNSSRPSKRDGLFPDFGVYIVDGEVWFWLLEQWHELPNELWAWKYVTVWTKGHYYYGSRIWVPSLLLFDFWEYDRSSYSRVTPSTIRIASSPALWSSTAVVIASRLFAFLRSSGESELCRTCRLACRDWANTCPLRDPERCNLSFKGGYVWYRIEEEWRYLPSRYWAWTPRYEEWWVDCRPGQWYLKLVQPVDDTVRQNPIYSSTLSLLPSSDSTSTRSGSSTVAALPPELHQYICEAADNESSSSRLVCRYWNRLCTPHVFERVDVNQSAEQIRTLWRHRTDPLIRHVKVVDKVPRYDKRSKFPWVHLLTQACASTRSIWMNEWGGQEEIVIAGPFAAGHRTVRSVHFTLPRSLPRSFSRGIKSLILYDITLSRLEDLAHLVCELFDLETLTCGSDTTIDPDSLPIEPPPRRPRTNRNKLRQIVIDVESEMVDRLEMALALYLSVYNAMSFFSDSEITIILTLLKPLHWLINPEFCCKYNPHEHSRRLYSGDSSYVSWSLQIVQDLPQNHTILNFVISCWSEDFADLELDQWAQLDNEFDRIKGLIWRANFVFGFEDRKHMIEFATNILERKMPSISKLATVRYSISIRNRFDWDQWYQASLDSEELTGTPRKHPWEVYP